MFVAALFTISKIQKQPKVPWMDEWMKKVVVYTVNPPHLWVPHLQIQPTVDQKHTRKKVFRTFHEAEFEFVTHQQPFTSHLHCTYNYLHSTYIILGIVSNLEMI